MRTLKLIFLFILIAGNIVLLFNLGSKQYGPEPAAMLSPAEKDKIFEEVIGKKIADEEFFETHLAKVIAQIYNEKHKQEPVLSPSSPDKAVEEVLAKEEAKKIAEKFNERYKGQDSRGKENEDDTAPAEDVVSDGLSRAAQRRDEVAQRDAEELAKEEAKEEAARKAKEEAARKAKEKAKEKAKVEAAIKAAENKAKKEAAGAKEKARAEILELVKKKDLAACETHPGWKKYLSDRERWDVELVLKPGSRYRNRLIKNTVIKYVNSKVFNGREITWELLKQTRDGIYKIESNSKSGLGLMEGVR